MRFCGKTSIRLVSLQTKENYLLFPTTVTPLNPLADWDLIYTKLSM